MRNGRFAHPISQPSIWLLLRAFLGVYLHLGETDIWVFDANSRRYGILDFSGAFCTENSIRKDLV